MADKRKDNLKNLKGHKFPKSPQGLDEVKSEGQIGLSIGKNLLYTLRTNIQDTNLVKKTVDGVSREVEQGKYDNAIKLINIAKEPEDQNINLNGGLEVQKVFVDEKTKNQVNKHIDKIINE